MTNEDDDVYPNITAKIGVCSIEYTENPKLNKVQSPSVIIMCPSVELLTAFNKCQMVIKQQDNVKYHDNVFNRQITITEPQDNTQITVTHNLFGFITSVSVGSINANRFNSGQLCYNMLWSNYYYNHRLHYSNPSLSMSLSTLLVEQHNLNK